MPALTAPDYPIIYIRGYAMTSSEIEATASTPYMGFNLGSTKRRQRWNGEVQKLIFESPLIRLMKDYGYSDVYCDGCELEDNINPKSIFIHRYYDQGDPDLGNGTVPSIEDAAEGLKALIESVKNRICGGDQEAVDSFRVDLVAHSMGGLIARCFLQSIATPTERATVEKVFTYATPHNGIEMLGFNVPGFLGLNDLNNFNRARMARFLSLPAYSSRVDTLDGKYDPKKFFCLVGTNPKDYSAAAGLSRKGAGALSDGLVRIQNATIQNAPRAFIHRSHSGPHGIVNSEEGYQNLVRFLFGDVKVKATMHVNDLPLPPNIQESLDNGRDVKASYFFESTISPRGAISYNLSERTTATESAVFRTFDELLRNDAPRSPVLFSTFLDTKKILSGRSLVFSIQLAVKTTGYEVDRKFLWDKFIPGEALFQETLVIRAARNNNGYWAFHYNKVSNAGWSDSEGENLEFDGQSFVIPLQSAKGFRAQLEVEFESSNPDR
jgi:hypothetical protein